MRKSTVWGRGWIQGLWGRLGFDSGRSIGLGTGGAMAPENGPKNVPIFCPPKRVEKFEAQLLGFTLFDAVRWPESGPKIGPTPVMDRADIQRTSRRLAAVALPLCICGCPSAFPGCDAIFLPRCGRPAFACALCLFGAFILARRYLHARFLARGH